MSARRPKMTLDELRAAIPTWLPPQRKSLAEAQGEIDRFLAESGKSEADLDADNRDFMERHYTSPRDAQGWLQRNSKIARTYLVAKLLCPKGKRLADLYCLPKDAQPVADSRLGLRLLVVPSNRGRLGALNGDPKNTRVSGAAWWCLSLDDVWELQCKCCPRPDGGVRARDFLDDDAHHSYSIVLI